MNLVAIDKLSPLELCDRGEYEAAAELAGVQVGQWPENVSGGDSGYAEAILVAGIITSTIGGIQQTADQGVAREMLAESIRLFGDDPRSLEAQSWLAWSDYRAGDLDSAMELSGKLLQGELDRPTRFRLLLLRSTVYWTQGFPDQAFAELLLMEPLYDECGPLAKGKFHEQRALIYRGKNELDRAIVDYDAAITFFREAGNVRWQGVATSNLVNVYLETEQFEKAHRYATKARDLFRELGDASYEAEALDQSAQVYLAEAKCLMRSGEKIKRIAGIHSCHACDTIRTVDPLPKTDPYERRGAIMNPLECASHLIQNPDNAAVLLDLLIWATSARNDPAHETDLDEIKEMLYSKTEDGVQHRKAYEGSRLLRAVTSEDS